MQTKNNATPQVSRHKNRGKPADGTPNKVDIHVGERIRLRRTLLKWRQADLGAKMGLTFQQIQKYEKGLNRVSASRLYDFSKVLGCNVSYFYQDMDETTKSESPRFLQTNAIYSHEDENLEDIDPLQNTTIQQFVKNFSRIKSPALSQKVYELLELLCKIQ